MKPTRCRPRPSPQSRLESVPRGPRSAASAAPPADTVVPVLTLESPPQQRERVDCPMPRTDTPSDQPDHTEKRRARKRELSQATLDLRRRRLGDNTPTSTTPQALYLQAEYEAWRDQLPESRTAELFEGVCDVDLDALDVELPRGFGRD